MNPEESPRTRALVLEVLSRGSWYTIYEVQGFLQIAGHRLISESACGARMRDLRKTKFGDHNLKSRPRAGSHAWEYQVEQAEQKVA